MAGHTVFSDPCGPCVCTRQTAYGQEECCPTGSTPSFRYGAVQPLRTSLLPRPQPTKRRPFLLPHIFQLDRFPLSQSSCIRPCIRNCNAKRDQIYAAVIKSRYIEVRVTSVSTHFPAASLLSTRRPCHEEILRTSAARQHDLDARRLRRTWPECGGSGDRRPHGYFNSPGPAKRNHYDHAQGDSNDNTGVAPRTNCHTTTDYDSGPRAYAYPRPYGNANANGNSNTHGDAGPEARQRGAGLFS